MVVTRELPGAIPDKDKNPLGTKNVQNELFILSRLQDRLGFEEGHSILEGDTTTQPNKDGVNKKLL